MSDEARKIQVIIDNCNEMINGKYLVACTKLSQMLKSIAECGMVYEILADCVSGFEFETQFKRACARMPNGKSHFVMPSRDEDILAMVFCIFVNIENKTIDFAAFLHDYFVKNNENEFDVFCRELVLPFRQRIGEMLLAIQKEEEDDRADLAAVSAEEESEPEETAEVSDELPPLPGQHSVFYEKMLKYIHLMVDAVKTADNIKPALRQEFFWVTDALLAAIETENDVLINGLMVALDRLAHEMKILKKLYQLMRTDLSQQSA